MPRVCRRTFSIFTAVLLIVAIYVHVSHTAPSTGASAFQHRQQSIFSIPRKYKWKNRKELYPVTSTIRLPQGTPTPLPQIQYDFASRKIDPHRRKIRNHRLEAVRDTLRRTWDAYKEKAWMADELGPLSGDTKNSFGNWGATLVDSLDTLWIMGLKREFDTAVDAVSRIDFTQSEAGTLNVFETTIRYLGGLLGAYDISERRYPVLLEKAVELGDMLYAAFDTPNRMPVTRWNWEHSKAEKPQEALTYSIAAEMGSLTLEFTHLSQLTGDDKYFDAVQRVTNAIGEQQNSTQLPGLWPLHLDALNQRFTDGREFSIGGLADSLYEYFPKEYILLNGLLPQYRTLYESALATAKEYLFFRPLNPHNADILLAGSVTRKVVDGWRLKPEGSHLACYAGGMVALGAKVFDRPEDLDIARKLVHGCVWAYNSTATGIMPEQFATIPCEEEHDAENKEASCDWSEDKWYKAVLDYRSKPVIGPPEDVARVAQKVIEKSRLPPGFLQVLDSRFLLRPEAIESVFVLYRITGDPALQEVAWTMFTAIAARTRTQLGTYAAVADVTDNRQDGEDWPEPPPWQQNRKNAEPTPRLLDQCESFWTAETLKYFYLVFADEGLVSLDEWVLNTEAHPLRRTV